MLAQTVLDTPHRPAHTQQQTSRELLAGAIVLVIAVAAAVIGKALGLSAWAQMWLTASALFFALKWATWRISVHTSKRPPLRRSIEYFLAWPGMNADEFLFQPAARKPIAIDWLRACAPTAAGLILIWVGSPFVISSNPLLGGWVGQIGYLCLLHFGLFQIVSLYWQSCGVKATPLMDRPFASRSVGEFWRRWNTAFRDASQALIYRPLHPRVGPRLAGAAVFLASGLIHELVISVPAEACYGMPTAYFMFQYAAILVERSRLGAAVGLRRGRLGRVYTCVVVWPPVLLLFPPAFVERVSLPFLTAIGAS